MSSLKVNNLTRAGGSGVPDLGGVAANRLLPSAWVNFNGTGVVAIRDQQNVSSITDNGVGDYTVNFATPMANANYSAVPVFTDTVVIPWAAMVNRANVLTTSVRVQQSGSTGSTVAVDGANCNLIVFGGQA